MESEQAIEMQITDPLIGIALWIARIIFVIFLEDILIALQIFCTLLLWIGFIIL